MLLDLPATGLRLRRLAFFGPNKPAASVTFGPGLNVLYGASDTGKSFIVEAIDFMTGGKPPLREIPERVGYDRVLLGLESQRGEAFTVVRSMDGGGFLLYEGDHEAPPGEEVQAKILGEQHSEKSEANLSMFLLGLCGLAGREALALLVTVQDIERRRTDLEKGQDDRSSSTVAQGDIPTSVAEGFSQSVEAILNAWHFPEGGRVYFDSKTRDLVIAGKQRIARGKGLRAITHAAFTLGLLDYCRTHATPHPGFVILDSPLLAYREPDGAEDDLTGTDLKEQFYTYLQSLTDDRQVIVVENTDPPPAIKALEQVKMFSKNPHSGRYGLFPFVAPVAGETGEGKLV